MSRRTSSASTSPDGLPSHWDRPIPDGKDYLCVKLQSISEEYKRTEKKFQETMDGSHEIVTIQRVQNPDLWTAYSQ